MVIEVVVGSLMSESVLTCKDNTPLSELVASMAMNKLSCIIVTEDERPIGIITERDLVATLNRFLHDPEFKTDILAKDVMSASPLVVKEMTPLFEALVITQTRGFRHLPVVDDNGYLVGILSFSDLARAYEKIMTQQKSALEEELGDKTRYLKEINEQLKAMSFQDALLGIGNRRAMEVDLEYTWRAAEGSGSDFALVLFDIDYFKQYNDFYGHQAGDTALKFVCQYVMNNIREGDRFYRYGGEEFLLLMADTTIDVATSSAKRIVNALYQASEVHEKSPENVITMSAGVSSFCVDKTKSWQDILQRADQALYQAKSDGRNLVRAA